MKILIVTAQNKLMIVLLIGQAIYLVLLLVFKRKHQLYMFTAWLIAPIFAYGPQEDK